MTPRDTRSFPNIGEARLEHRQGRSGWSVPRLGPPARAPAARSARPRGGASKHRAETEQRPGDGDQWVVIHHVHPIHVTNDPHQVEQRSPGFDPQPYMWLIRDCTGWVLSCNQHFSFVIAGVVAPPLTLVDVSMQVVKLYHSPFTTCASNL